MAGMTIRALARCREGRVGRVRAEIEDAAETGSSRRVSAGSVDGGGGYGRHAGAAYTFSQEAVREFRVSGQNYSALYGHAAGGIITTVSKSGTNDDAWDGLLPGAVERVGSDESIFDRDDVCRMG